MVPPQEWSLHIFLWLAWICRFGSGYFRILSRQCGSKLNRTISRWLYILNFVMFFSFSFLFIILFYFIFCIIKEYIVYNINSKIYTILKLHTYSKSMYITSEDENYKTKSQTCNYDQVPRPQRLFIFFWRHSQAFISNFKIICHLFFTFLKRATIVKSSRYFQS